MVNIKNVPRDLVPSVLGVNKYADSEYDTFKSVMCTVESPNNGHFGEMTSVRCRELSASGDWFIILSNYTIYIILNAVLHLFR